MKITIVSDSLAHLLNYRSAFEALGCALEHVPCSSEAQLAISCRDSFGIICSGEPFTAEVIRKLRGCRVISRHGIGTDTIDDTAATEAGIIVANVPDYGLDEVSDHAMAFCWRRRAKSPSSTKRSGAENGACAARNHFSACVGAGWVSSDSVASLDWSRKRRGRSASKWRLLIPMPMKPRPPAEGCDWHLSTNCVQSRISYPFMHR